MIEGQSVEQGANRASRQDKRCEVGARGQAEGRQQVLCSSMHRGIDLGDLDERLDRLERLERLPSPRPKIITIIC